MSIFSAIKKMYNPRATAVLKFKVGYNLIGDFHLLHAYIAEHFPQKPKEPYNENEERGVSFFCLGLTDALYAYSNKKLMPEEYFHLLNAICFDLQVSEEQTKEVYKYAIFDQSLNIYVLHSETKVAIDEVQVDLRKIFKLGFETIGCFFDEGKFKATDFKENVPPNSLNRTIAKQKSAEARELIANLH